MAQWMAWAIAAGLLVMLEIFTGTFYLLMIAFGIIAGAIAAALDLPSGVQFIVAAVVGAVATVALNRSKLGKTTRTDSARDPNVNLDIGQAVTIAVWTMPEGGTPVARVMHRGAQWDVEYAGSGTPAPGIHQIIEIRGSCLLVKPMHSHKG
ncbi:membrane protein implicated in regulation of membrane protease activity [Actimicrobium sp. GrIS 1.19]|uniref:NfeD family protein n=1 Tax=Actimicrobium sp. GrIS 1.19 TaxID=3071708 RepID=UPI002E0C3DD7|nr:membrane protein implicated in regulation of membrane protease activity [Actimicrobium sp. GrIS 1.19]